MQVLIVMTSYSLRARRWWNALLARNDIETLDSADDAVQARKCCSRNPTTFFA